MSQRRVRFRGFLAVQLLVLVAVGVSWVVLPGARGSHGATTIDASNSALSPSAVAAAARNVPLRIEPLYDDPDVVSDEQLAAVLKRIRPRFSRSELKPNFVEHALRTWGVEASFGDADVLSGAALRDFLLDHSRFVQSWGRNAEPLLIDRPRGISIRTDRTSNGSVHHDHLLASLTEAGLQLDEQVFAPSREGTTLRDVFEESLRDFRLDERETEWSAMAFALRLPPGTGWCNGAGRRITFDLIAERLMRGHDRFGVCSGTHRVYSLVLLLRLHDRIDIFTGATREKVFTHLEHVRDLIAASQFEDGHWPTNWSAGSGALSDPIDEPIYKQVIATGHHLEWLALAPESLHPPREQIRRAAAWCIHNTLEQPEETVQRRYTFYSHVGNALALWRGTRPAEFERRRSTRTAARIR